MHSFLVLENEVILTSLHVIKGEKWLLAVLSEDLVLDVKSMSEPWAWIRSVLDIVCWNSFNKTAVDEINYQLIIWSSGSDSSSHHHQIRRFNRARVQLRRLRRYQNPVNKLCLCSCVFTGLVCSKYFPSRGVNGEELPASGELRWNVCHSSSCGALDFHWMHPSTRRTEVSLSPPCWLWSLARNLESLFPLTQNTCATH